MSDPAQSFGHDDGGASRPNYLVRRLVFTGLIVAGIALVAIVIGRIIEAREGESGTVEVDTAWDTVVTVDERTGRITMSDPDGSGAEEVSTNSGRVNATAMIGDTVFVAGARTSVAMNLSGDRPSLDVSDLLDGDVTIVRPSGTTELVMFTNGTDAVFVGSDIDRVAATSADGTEPGVEWSLEDTRVSGDGTAVLLRDEGNFQSVLLRFGDEPPSYFAGVPLAVDHERVATVQNVGGSGTVVMSDHVGAELARFTTQPVLAGMLIEGGVLTVDRSGMIHVLRGGGDDVVGTIDAAPTGYWVTTTADRLIVSTADGVTVIDDDGDVLSSTTATALAVTGPSPASATPLRPGCQVLDGAAEALSLLNLRDGEPLAEGWAADTRVFSSADGCTAIATSPDSTGGDTSTGARASTGAAGSTAPATTGAPDASTEPEEEEAAGASVLTADWTRPLANAFEEVLALSPDGGTIALGRAGRLVVEEVEVLDPEADGEADTDDDTNTDDDDDPDDDTDPDADADADDDEGLGAITPHVHFADL